MFNYRKTLATVRRVFVALCIGAMIGFFAGALANRAHAAEMPSCPGDNTVWVNARSHVFHYRGTVNYGATQTGTYACEKQALAAGNRAAKNETRPTIPCDTDSDCAAKNGGNGDPSPLLITWRKSDDSAERAEQAAERAEQAAERAAERAGRAEERAEEREGN